MPFKITSDFKPTGDQPEAIKKLTQGVMDGVPAQVLLGVTGSGKTFTIANVIEKVQKPTLVLCHNKTLAAQLYSEFSQFFPENAVEYFISYYDYYQPEAYIASSNLYIEKDLSINEEIEKLRLKTTSSLLTGRRDIIVVASVSCIYGIGNPEEFGKNIISLKVGETISRNQLLLGFVDILYSRTERDFTRGTFRVKGDIVDIFPAYADFAYRIVFWGDEIEEIQRIEPDTGKKINSEKAIVLYPANLFVTGKDVLQQAMKEIQDDLMKQVSLYEDEGRHLEAKRLLERTEHDLEMMRELGYCSGIENYSRYFDRRKPGSRPFCLIDYFPNDFLMVVDESHATLPQVRAMWGGDRSRKVSLVENGFRLPAAMDNRPLKFDEFQDLVDQFIYVSATPGNYELEQTEGEIVEQVIRPTGLLDPAIEVRPVLNQIDDLLEEVNDRVRKDERVLITTLTKRMAEEMDKYLKNINIKSSYIHSEVDTLDRVEILRQLRLGVIDVLVGVNLLREGLDLPEVSLVAILDADKEGFLRDERSLIQTIGRAARNENGTVIMYADRITNSMQKAIDETTRRRKIQTDYNVEHGITPQTIRKSKKAIMEQTSVADRGTRTRNYYVEPELTIAADPIVAYMNKEQLEKLVKETRSKMEKAAKELNFTEAARLRDDMFALQEKINSGT